jgi:acyl transferase domain-containing protein
MNEKEYSEQLKKALEGINKLKSKIVALEAKSNEPIAIIGMSCRFPGGSNTPDLYWNNLYHSKDLLKKTPLTRWDNTNKQYPIFSEYAYFMDDPDDFDAAFFSILPKHAKHMDPQQKLVLQTSWEALENAAINPSSLCGSRTGLYLGIHSFSVDYFLKKCPDLTNLNRFVAVGSSHSILTSRFSYFLDLKGPTVAVDTACSSSLVSMHLACQSLRLGETNLALAGGVHLMLTPHLGIMESTMSMLSKDGRCKTFDASADGFGRGEGCGIVVLKRLSDALADNDPIRGVLLGSAVGQDGHSAGITAPNGLAQKQVIIDALHQAKVDASQVTYVETHGTGTVLGDPIEVEAIQAVYGKPRCNGSHCILGAVKSNIGHLESAAGVAGVIKAILSLENKCIPKNLHFNQINPKINLKNSAIKIAEKLQSWPNIESEPRFAGVSSFGWSGVNAHMIIGEAPHQDIKKIDYPILCLPLSAKSVSSLKNLIAAYHNFIETHSMISLTDICYTAAVGREHFKHRIIFLADSRDDLLMQLANIESEALISSATQESTKLSELPAMVELPENTMDKQQWHQIFLQIGRDYLATKQIDWQIVYKNYPANKIPLPTYQWDR